MPKDKAPGPSEYDDTDRPPTSIEQQIIATRAEAEQQSEPVPPLGMAFNGERMRRGRR